MSKGFSIVELLVTIAILTIVTGTVFFNQGQFNNSVLIENLAYEISLAIRQAQSYGVQVKQTGGNFSEGYGVYFEKDTDQDPDEFFIFADIYPASPNFIYDAGYDEIVDTLRMTNGNKVSQLCVESNCSVNSISIGFLRPNPTAIIKSGSTEYNTAEIHVTSPKGVQKKVFVNKVGQISVQSI